MGRGSSPSRTGAGSTPSWRRAAGPRSISGRSMLPAACLSRRWSVTWAGSVPSAWPCKRRTSGLARRSSRRSAPRLILMCRERKSALAPPAGWSALERRQHRARRRRERVPEAVDYLVCALLIGAGATVVMDLWLVARKRLLGVPSLDYGLVGRWLAYLARGRFRHDPIAASPPVQGERLI